MVDVSVEEKKKIEVEKPDWMSGSHTRDRCKLDRT